MSQEPQPTTCVLCGNANSTRKRLADLLDHFSCTTCNEYQIDVFAQNCTEDILCDENKLLFSRLAKNTYENGKILIINRNNWNYLIELANRL